MTKNQFLEKITEGSTDIFVFKNKKTEKGPASKEKMPFFNPSMQLNRDLSILICQLLVNKCKYKPVLLDGLAASGARGLRLANEIKGDFEVEINDVNPECFDLIKKNIEHLKIKNAKAFNKNLNVLLSEGKFDYIDVDPFGSPVYFVDSAMRAIKKDGIIAFTATDTAALCGVYPKVCLRRYAAVPFHSVAMKEIGLRILLGFICKSAAVYDKGVEPILSYVTDHYFRVYVRVRKSVAKANKSMSNIKTIKSAGYERLDRGIGPLWAGKIQDKNALKELRTILFEKTLGKKNELWKLLNLLEEESDMPDFFYTTDSLSSFFKTSSPKLELLFNKIKEKDFRISRTHFSPTGFKTNAPIEVIEKVFKGN